MGLYQCFDLKKQDTGNTEEKSFRCNLLLEDMINDEHVNKVKDTFHNALSIGVVQQDLYLLAAAYIFLRNTSYFSLINLLFSSEK